MGEAQPGPGADRGPARVVLRDQTKRYYPIATLALVSSASRDVDQRAAELGFGLSGLVAFPLVPMRPPRRIRRKRFRCPNAVTHRTVFERGRARTVQVVDCTNGRVGVWYIEREVQVAPAVGIPVAVLLGEAEGGRYANQSFAGAYLGLTFRRSRSARLAGLGFALDLGYQLGRLARDRCTTAGCVRESELAPAGLRLNVGLTAGRFAFGAEYSFIIPGSEGAGTLHLFGGFVGLHY